MSKCLRVWIEQHSRRILIFYNRLQFIFPKKERVVD
jgi:hypothetical protein